MSGNDGRGNMAPAAIANDDLGTVIISPNDVLCGRGASLYSNPGNKLFYALVEMRQRDYLAAPSKRVKGSIALSIVSEIRALNGRFLQRDSTSGLWKEIGDEKAREKTSQVLRKNAPAILAEIEREVNEQQAWLYLDEPPSSHPANYSPHYGHVAQAPLVNHPNPPPPKQPQDNRNDNNGPKAPPPNATGAAPARAIADSTDVIAVGTESVETARVNLPTVTQSGRNAGASSHLATGHVLNIPSAPAKPSAPTETSPSLSVDRKPASTGGSAKTKTPVVEASPRNAQTPVEVTSSNVVVDLTEDDDDEPTTASVSKPAKSTLPTRTSVGGLEPRSASMSPPCRPPVESRLDDAARAASDATCNNKDMLVQRSHVTDAMNCNDTDSKLASKSLDSAAIVPVLPTEANTATTNAPSSTESARPKSPLAKLADNRDDEAQNTRCTSRNVERAESTPSSRELKQSHDGQYQAGKMSTLPTRTTFTLDEAIEFLSYKYMIDHEYDEIAFRADRQVRAMIHQVYLQLGKSDMVTLRHRLVQDDSDKDEHPKEETYLCLCCNYKGHDDSTCQLFSLFHSAYAVASLNDPSKVPCSICNCNGWRADDDVAHNEGARTGDTV